MAFEVTHILLHQYPYLHFVTMPRKKKDYPRCKQALIDYFRRMSSQIMIEDMRFR